MTNRDAEGGESPAVGSKPRHARPWRGRRRIFISYAHSDREVARQVARGLERAGLFVWWDERVASGQPFRTEIERALDSVDAVLVLWSGASASSPWVAHEASRALARKAMYAVCIEGDVSIPGPFSEVNAPRLRLDSMGFDQDIQALAVTLARSSTGRSWALLLAGTIVLFLGGLAVGAAVVRPKDPPSTSDLASSLAATVLAAARPPPWTEDADVVASVVRGDWPDGPDAWLQAQALAALSSHRSDHGQRDAVTAALSRRLVHLQRLEDGAWAEHPDPLPQVAVTAWAVRGLLAALRNGRVSADFTPEVKRAVQRGVRFLLDTQLPNGTWATYPLKHPCLFGSARSTGPYATEQALVALTEAEGETSSEDAPTAALARRRGVAGIWAAFDPVRSAWAGSASVVASDEVTLTYLHALSVAMPPGTDPRHDRAFAAVTDAWLRRTSQAGTRGLGDGVVVSEMNYECEDGTHVSGQRPNAPTQLWYPWSLVVAARACGDERLSPDTRTLAKAVKCSLQARYPEVPESFHSGFTYQPAELLLVLEEMSRGDDCTCSP